MSSDGKKRKYIDSLQEIINCISLKKKKKKSPRLKEKTEPMYAYK